MSRISSLLAAILIITGTLFARPAAAANTNAKPFVVPELRQWTGKTGSFTPGAGCTITIADTTLAKVARDFADDYKTMFGTELPVKVGKSAKGNIHFALKANSKLGTEGYTVEISDRVAVTAPTVTGAYWSTRTLLQIAEQSDSHSLPCGRITDWPDYALRGLSMDVGRKFFPMDYLKDLVKILSYYKMNSLRIHLNDNGFPYYFGNDWDKTYSAFRMESTRFPGLTARDGYYTKDEFRDFQRFAAGEFVDIVPEIDIPAHALPSANTKKV